MHLSLFPNKLNEFNNTGALMLDSIYHRTLELLKNHIFGMKTSKGYHVLCNVIISDHTCFSCINICRSEEAV